MEYCCLVTNLCQTLCHAWTAAHQVALSSTISCTLLKFTSTESVMLSKYLFLCLPFSICLQSFPASGLFQWVSSSHQYQSFSFNYQSFQWIFRVDFLQDWLVWSFSPGALKSLLQNHSLKASIIRGSAFFMVQLSYPHMTTGKPIVWLHKPLMAKCHLFFLICYLDLS